MVQKKKGKLKTSFRSYRAGIFVVCAITSAAASEARGHTTCLDYNSLSRLRSRGKGEVFAGQVCSRVLLIQSFPLSYPSTHPSTQCWRHYTQQTHDQLSDCCILLFAPTAPQPPPPPPPTQQFRSVTWLPTTSAAPFPSSFSCFCSTNGCYVFSPRCDSLFLSLAPYRTDRGRRRRSEPKQMRLSITILLLFFISCTEGEGR